MAAEKDIIVALELASTAIRAIAGQRMPDGTMQVLAVAEENASNCIRKGVVDNIDKTTQAISRVVGQLNLQLAQTVKRVYVGLSGQSLHSVLNAVPHYFAERTQVTDAMIDQLMDTNGGVVYPESSILEVIPQEYQIGTRSVMEPVGMMVEQLEARFLNIIARSSLQENIRKCVRGADLELVDTIISPIALANTMLSANEKRSGSALVDMGADTTTVSIYTNNMLRHLVVLPIGGNNVTGDICSQKVEHDEAESLKLRYAYAWHENADADGIAKVKLSYDRTIDETVLSNIIESRYEEILVNVWKQLEAEGDKLTSGIVFTGGAAQVRNLAEGFLHYSHGDRSVRIAKGLPGDIVTLAPGVHLDDNGRMCTLMSLLLHGEENCVSRIVETTEEQSPVAEPEPEDVAEEKPAEETPAVQEEPVQEGPKKPSAFSKLIRAIKDSLSEEV